MATKTGILTINGIQAIECDSDPSVGGLSALIGSYASATDGSGVFYKSALSDTSWVKLATQVYVDNLKADLIYKINTPISHTGTILPTVIDSYEIVSGTSEANDFMKFSLRQLATNNANSKTLKLWANTSNTIVGATQLGVYTFTTNSGGVFWFKRTMFFKNSLTSQKMINTTISHANDDVSYPNNGDTSLALDFTASVWILIEVTLANATDTFTLNAYMNKIER